MIHRIDKTQHNPETLNSTPSSKTNQHSKFWNASSLRPMDAYDLDGSVRYAPADIGAKTCYGCT